ncbi:hypothetical protein EUA93_14955 [Nocardioides oleivorans]|uniref:DUF2029 domain-containing protein n=1 Tax=Nocardioides oleivorans TaxID=273676 RepID=A0A4Q2S1U9_9ACTN|nr:hypothetical protein [Nocardioides oleivorans]RYB95527.1 hypothetical protein EUA93_14955 [Nocardioides oleivorans]
MSVDSQVPVARALTVLTGTVCLLSPWASTPVLSATYALLLGALVVALLVVVRRPGAAVGVRPLLWLMAAAAVVGVALVGGIALVNGAGVPVLATAPVVLVLGGAAILVPGCLPRWSYAVLAVAYAVLVAAFVSTWDQPIDVEVFVRDGVAALARGESPYALTFADVYPPGESARVYGPGVVEDGRLQFGFPYLPAVLLLDLPMGLVGDPVWMHALLLGLALALGWRVASDALGRAAIVVLALAPATPLVLANYWIEPAIAGLFALTWWGMHRGRTWAVVLGLGAFFSAKQYAAYFLPALWPVLRSSGVRVVLAAGAVGVVVVGSLALMDPREFYWSVVQLQFVQPFRDDAVSLLPALQEAVGELPGWLTTVSSLTGIVVSALVAWRTRPGPTAFALCVGLGLLATVVLAKQAFVNYYSLIGAVLLLAGVGWPEDDPAQTREPSSQGSRGERGISSTR